MEHVGAKKKFEQAQKRSRSRPGHSASLQSYEKNRKTGERYGTPLGKGVELDIGQDNAKAGCCGNMRNAPGAASHPGHRCETE